MLWLRAVSYCAELDSAQYGTAGNLTLHSIILHGTPEKYEYLSENKTKNETVLTHWSVAQAGSKDEKKLGVENLVGLSF